MDSGTELGILLFHFSFSAVHTEVSQLVLNLISLKYNDAEHLFLCLLDHIFKRRVSNICPCVLGSFYVNLKQAKVI